MTQDATVGETYMPSALRGFASGVVVFVAVLVSMLAWKRWRADYLGSTF